MKASTVQGSVRCLVNGLVWRIFVKLREASSCEWIKLLKVFKASGKHELKLGMDFISPFKI